MIRKSLLMLVIVAMAAVAAAAPKTARDFYQSATSHYNLSEWQAALDDFREAYRLKADPALLFNIAQCYRQLGNYREAANSYRAYRREGGSNDVEKLIADMDNATAAQREREAAAERDRAAAAPPTGVQPPSGSATTGNGAELTATAPPPERRLTKKPWFWAVVGVGAAAVVTGVTLAIVFGTPAKDPKLAFGTVQGN